MAKNNICTIILSDRKYNYEFKVSENFLEEFLNDNLDIIIANEVDTTVNALRITTSQDGVIIDNGITKRLFAYLKSILVLNEGKAAK